ncbi:MAG: methyltransferase domain-containing protein, partial [Candidatus Omnitrophota bacterium]
ISVTELELIINIFIVSDIFENGNNAFKMRVFRAKDTEDLYQTFEFLNATFREGRISDSRLVDVLKQIWSYESESCSTSGILNAATEARTQTYPACDRAKPRQGFNEQDVVAAAKRIIKNGFSGWRVVDLNESWLKEVRSYYEATNDTARLQKLKELIRQDCLRAGPSETFYGANLNNYVLIATNNNPNPAATLVHELNDGTHQENTAAESIFLQNRQPDLSHVYVVVMAGGASSRFFPINKIFADPTGRGRTMIQQAFDRATLVTPEGSVYPNFISAERFFVVTGADAKPTIQAQLGLPDSNVLAEPGRRNTLPAILWTIAHIRRLDPEATVVILTADHVIGDLAVFRQTVAQAINVSQTKPAIVTIGINPSADALEWTAFGAINAKSGATLYGDDIHEVARFEEKPKVDRAQQMILERTWSWNAGMFVFNISTMEQALADYQPQISATYQAMVLALAGSNLPEAASQFNTLPGKIPHPLEQGKQADDSIDYAVMVPLTTNPISTSPVEAYVIAGRFPWVDIGSWDALRKVVAPDQSGNVRVGRTQVNNVSNSILVAQADREIQVTGLKDIVVVHADSGTVMVCPVAKAQDVKKLKEELDKDPSREIVLVDCKNTRVIARDGKVTAIGLENISIVRRGNLVKVRALKPLKFGTSGLRDFIIYISDMESYINTRGFVEYIIRIGDIQRGDLISIAGDLRPSTRRILRAVAKAIIDSGCKVDYCGRIPSPAVAYWAMQNGRASIMVTGSHIPVDQNGIKYNKRVGEVLKCDEKGMLEEVAKVRLEEYARLDSETLFDDDANFKEELDDTILAGTNTQAERFYVERYVRVFAASQPLRGKTVVVYQHSAVGRDILVEVLQALGANVIPVERKDTERGEFVAIDTEDVKDEDKEFFQELRRKYPHAFAIVSTDGDSDRPFVIDENGIFHRGDVLGVVVAKFLGADSASVPISASPAVEEELNRCGIALTQTQIGSPYVIVGMMQAQAQAYQRVVSWEVNGGFLTQTTFIINDQELLPVPTRDALLPILAPLLSAVAQNTSVSNLFIELERWSTDAGLIDRFPTQTAKDIIRNYSPPDSNIAWVIFKEDRVGVIYKDGAARDSVLTDPFSQEMLAKKQSLENYFSAASHGFSTIVRICFIDGVKIYFSNNDIVHMRPSGNSPQFRCYSASKTSMQRAVEIKELVLREDDGIYRQMERNLQQNDPASPRPGHSEAEVVARFQESQSQNFPGFSPVSGNEPWIQKVRNYYQRIGDEARLAKLEDLIRRGLLRAGPDEKLIFFGANDGSVYLIATNNNPNLAATLIHELNGGTHQENLSTELQFVQFLRELKGGIIKKVVDLIKKVYDAADEYQLENYPRMQETIQEALEGIAYKARVLDLATGPGIAAYLALECGATEVVGVDISENMLKKAKARLSKCERQDRNIRLIKTDILELDKHLVSADGVLEQFDVVILANVLCHYNVVQQETILQSVVKFIKHGGCLVLVSRESDIKRKLGYDERRIKFLVNSKGEALSIAGYKDLLKNNLRLKVVSSIKNLVWDSDIGLELGDLERKADAVFAIVARNQDSEKDDQATLNLVDGCYEETTGYSEVREEVVAEARRPRTRADETLQSIIIPFFVSLLGVIAVFFTFTSDICVQGVNNFGNSINNYGILGWLLMGLVIILGISKTLSRQALSTSISTFRASLERVLKTALSYLSCSVAKTICKYNLLPSVAGGEDLLLCNGARSAENVFRFLTGRSWWRQGLTPAVFGLIAFLVPKTAYATTGEILILGLSLVEIISSLALAALIIFAAIVLKNMNNYNVGKTIRNIRAFYIVKKDRSLKRVTAIQNRICASLQRLEKEGIAFFIEKSFDELTPDSIIRVWYKDREGKIIPRDHVFIFVKKEMLSNTDLPGSLRQRYFYRTLSNRVPSEFSGNEVRESIYKVEELVLVESLLQRVLEVARRVGVGVTDPLTMQEGIQILRDNHYTSDICQRLSEIIRRRSDIDNTIKLSALRMLQIRSLTTRPLPIRGALVRYAWGGFGNAELLGMELEPIAENWLGFTETTPPGKEQPSVIAGTELSVGNLALPELNLRKFLEFEPQVLGRHAPKKPFFVKFLSTRFPAFVHLGFKTTVDPKEYCGLLCREVELIRQLFAGLRDNLTEDGFKTYEKAYADWATQQALVDWQDSQIVDLSAYLKPEVDGIDLLRQIRDNRAKIVAPLHKIDLRENLGKALYVWGGSIHAIFGLSHQFHTATGSEAKNECWIPIKVIGRDGQEHILIVEPQQTSNRTYSPADFYTPIIWKDGKPALRKPKMAEDIVAAEALMDFRAWPLSYYLKDSQPLSGNERQLVTDPWPYFSVTEVRLANGESIGFVIKNGDYSEGVVSKGTVIIISRDGRQVKISQGQGYFIPAGIDYYTVKQPKVDHQESHFFKFIPPSALSILLGITTFFGFTSNLFAQGTDNVLLTSHSNLIIALITVIFLGLLTYIVRNLRIKQKNNLLKNKLGNVYQSPTDISLYERLEIFTALVNRLIELFAKERKSEKAIMKFLREAKDFALRGDFDVEKSQAIQIIVTQALNIIFWIKQGVPGAEKMRVTSRKKNMFVNQKYGGATSYLDKNTFGIEGAPQEGRPGFFWRGFEGIKKLGKINEAVVVVQDFFTRATDRCVMYIMDHGFIKIPEGLVALTQKGEVSTIHETSFVHDVVPGTIQVTSTGIGHHQGNTLDIKHVTQGRGVQLLIKYNAQGEVEEILAQHLKPGSWTLALPGYVDAVVNLGGLRFNDISAMLTSLQVERISGRGTTSQMSAVVGALKQVEEAAYLVVKMKRGKAYLVANQNSDKIRWFDATSRISEIIPQSLLEFYPTLDEEKLINLVNRLVVSIIPTDRGIDRLPEKDLRDVQEYAAKINKALPTGTLAVLPLAASFVPGLVTILIILGIVGLALYYIINKIKLNPALKSKMDELRKLFNLSTEQLREIISSFHEEMARGLAGEPSSLKMLPAYVDNPTGKEFGQFLALDLGGTNFRILLIELNGDSSKPVIVAQESYALTPEQISSDAQVLFDSLAQQIKDFLIKHNCYVMKKAPLVPTLEDKDFTVYQLGFTFSFPMNQTAINQGILIHWSKEFTAKGVVGEDVVRLLQDALNRAYLDKIRVVSINNDTTGTESARAYLELNCDLAMILGTGTNICLRILVSGIKKAMGQYSGHQMIVNTESGNFNKLPRTAYDEQLDKQSEDPGSHLQEKMVSGKYIGELTRLILKGLLFEGKIPVLFSTKDNFTSVHMARIEGIWNLFGFGPWFVLRKMGLKNISLQDARVIREVCKIVSTRAARIAVSVLAGAVTYQDRDLTRTHTVAIDGSIYEKYPRFARRMRQTFAEIFGPDKAKRIKMVLTKDGSGVGAAIIAAMASSQRQNATPRNGGVSTLGFSLPLFGLISNGLLWVAVLTLGVVVGLIAYKLLKNLFVKLHHQRGPPNWLQNLILRLYNWWLTRKFRKAFPEGLDQVLTGVKEAKVVQVLSQNPHDLSKEERRKVDRLAIDLIHIYNLAAVSVWRNSAVNNPLVKNLADFAATKVTEYGYDLLAVPQVNIASEGARDVASTLEIGGGYGILLLFGSGQTGILVPCANDPLEVTNGASSAKYLANICIGSHMLANYLGRINVESLTGRLKLLPDNLYMLKVVGPKGSEVDVCESVEMNVRKVAQARNYEHTRQVRAGLLLRGRHRNYINDLLRALEISISDISSEYQEFFNPGLEEGASTSEEALQARLTAETEKVLEDKVKKASGYLEINNSWGGKLILFTDGDLMPINSVLDNTLDLIMGAGGTAEALISIMLANLQADFSGILISHSKTKEGKADAMQVDEVRRLIADLKYEDAFTPAELTTFKEYNLLPSDIYTTNDLVRGALNLAVASAPKGPHNWLPGLQGIEVSEDGQFVSVYALVSRPEARLIVKITYTTRVTELNEKITRSSCEDIELRKALADVYVALRLYSLAKRQYTLIVEYLDGHGREEQLLRNEVAANIRVVDSSERFFTDDKPDTAILKSSFDDAGVSKLSDVLGHLAGRVVKLINSKGKEKTFPVEERVNLFEFLGRVLRAKPEERSKRLEQFYLQLKKEEDFRVLSLFLTRVAQAPVVSDAEARVVMIAVLSRVRNNPTHSQAIKKLIKQLARQRTTNNLFKEIANSSSGVPADAAADGRTPEQVAADIERLGGLDTLLDRYLHIYLEELKRQYLINQKDVAELRRKHVIFVRGPPELGIANFPDERQAKIYIFIPENATSRQVRHEIRAVLNPEITHLENLAYDLDEVDAENLGQEIARDLQLQYVDDSLKALIRYEACLYLDDTRLRIVDKSYALKCGLRIVSSTSLLLRLFRLGKRHFLKFVRLGYIFFIDSKEYMKFNPVLQDRLGNNVILIKELTRSVLSNSWLRSFTLAAIVAMLETRLFNKQVIDAGCGDGILSLVAAKLGASSLVLIDNDAPSLAQARKSLVLNGLQETRDYVILEKDISDTQGVLSVLRVLPMVKLGTQTAIVSNIGYWPKTYQVSNKEVINLLRELTGVVIFIAGGYLVVDGERYNNFGQDRESIGPQEESIVKHFTIAPKLAIVTNRASSAVAWIAERNPKQTGRLYFLSSERMPAILTTLLATGLSLTQLNALDGGVSLIAGLILIIAAAVLMIIKSNRVLGAVMGLRGMNRIVAKVIASAILIFSFGITLTSCTPPAHEPGIVFLLPFDATSDTEIENPYLQDVIEANINTDSIATITDVKTQEDNIQFNPDIPDTFDLTDTSDAILIPDTQVTNDIIPDVSLLELDIVPDLLFPSDTPPVVEDILGVLGDILISQD